MEATKFFPSNLLHLLGHQHPSHLINPKNPQKPSIVYAAFSGRGSSWKSCGGGDHDHYAGNLVDENMVVLRMRIRETKMWETRSEPPSDWMEWEKRYYENNGYNEDVCEAVGFVQNYLMNVRPGLALGLVAIVALSLVFSTGVVLFHAIHIAQILLSYFVSSIN